MKAGDGCVFAGDNLPKGTPLRDNARLPAYSFPQIGR